MSFGHVKNVKTTKIKIERFNLKGREPDLDIIGQIDKQDKIEKLDKFEKLEKIENSTESRNSTKTVNFDKIEKFDKKNQKFDKIQ